jgi:hypothetical protein
MAQTSGFCCRFGEIARLKDKGALHSFLIHPSGENARQMGVHEIEAGSLGAWGGSAKGKIFSRLERRWRRERC